MNKTAKIVAISVDKGGNAKTTTAINTAAGLSKRGKRVLIVDLDQQCNLTHVLLPTSKEKTLFDALKNKDEDLPVYKVQENLDLVPASHRMFGIGIDLVARQTKAMLNHEEELDCRSILATKLEKLKSSYDYILLDCPPSDNILTINALYATEYVVIPVTPEPFCVDGVLNYGKIMRAMKDDANPGLKLAGILVTNFETGSIGHIKGEEALRKWAPKFIFETRIRHSRPLYNANLARQDVFSYAPESNGAYDYSAFVDEFILRVQ